MLVLEAIFESLMHTFYIQMTFLTHAFEVSFLRSLTISRWSLELHKLLLQKYIILKYFSEIYFHFYLRTHPRTPKCQIKSFETHWNLNGRMNIHEIFNICMQLKGNFHLNWNSLVIRAGQESLYIKCFSNVLILWSNLKKCSKFDWKMNKIQ